MKRLVQLTCLYWRLGSVFICFIPQASLHLKTERKMGKGRQKCKSTRGGKKKRAENGWRRMKGGLVGGSRGSELRKLAKIHSARGRGGGGSVVKISRRNVNIGNQNKGTLSAFHDWVGSAGLPTTHDLTTLTIAKKKLRVPHSASLVTRSLYWTDLFEVGEKTKPGRKKGEKEEKN